jgi:hypothetical protein
VESTAIKKSTKNKLSASHCNEDIIFNKVKQGQVKEIAANYYYKYSPRFGKTVSYGEL